MENILWPFFIAVCILAYCYGFSFTEWGPFTQLPSGRYLEQKTGKNNVVNYWLNQDGFSIDRNGNIKPDPNNVYLNELRKSFFFRYMGMVYTGIPFLPIPWIGGVTGGYVRESRLKFVKNTDGTVTPSVEDLPTVYYTARPIRIKSAIVLGGIPIKGFNQVEFAFSMTNQITNTNDYNNLTGETRDQAKGNFESMIRPEVANKPLKEVQQIQSERGGSTSSTFIDKLVTAVNKVFEDKRYGLEIVDLNIPHVEPMGEYADAERKAAINEALRVADVPSVQQAVNRELKVGMATAKVRKALAEATSPWVSLEKGLAGVQPGATVVIGNGVINSLPLGGKDRGDREDKTTQRTKP